MSSAARRSSMTRPATEPTTESGEALSRRVTPSPGGLSRPPGEPPFGAVLPLRGSLRGIRGGEVIARNDDSNPASGGVFHAQEA